MDVRERLAKIDRPVEFDPETVTIADEDVFDRFEPVVKEWWLEEFGAYVAQNEGLFTPPQREAIPLIDEGKNVLVCAPTGSGKTLSSFAAIINDLFRRDRDEIGRASCRERV